MQVKSIAECTILSTLITLPFAIKISFFKTNYRLMQVKSIAECTMLSTLITLPFARKINFLSIFERPFYTGFTVIHLFTKVFRSTLCIYLCILPFGLKQYAWEGLLYILRGHRLEFLNEDVHQSLQRVFILAKEMSYSTAFHLGFQCYRSL